MSKCTMKDVYDRFGLEPATKDFIGHAMALYLTDSYIDEPGRAPEAVERIRLYGNSVARYGKSPYIYPLYGLGELPQGFARLSAIYGGTYMLNTSVDELLYDDAGRAVGIRATMGGIEPEMKFETRAPMILGDASYFPGKARVVGQVLRAICVLRHPLERTNDSDSCQLIIPQSQVGRKNGQCSPVGGRVARVVADHSDIYIACVSAAHNVCPKGYWIAIVSTIAETPANHHLELQPGLERLGKIEEQFMVCLHPPFLAPHAPRRGGCRYTSPSPTGRRTTSSSPRATTPPATSRPPPTTSGISTADAWERSW